MSGGHCDHCGPRCEGGEVYYDDGQYRRRHDNDTYRDEKHNDATAVWDDGHCPACAERARIVAAIEADRSR